MKIKYIIGIFALLALGVYFWYQGSKNDTAAVRYVTAPAERGTLVMSVSGSGNIVIDQLSTVDPTITGTIANLSVNVGDTVKKGQFLFSIINEDLAASAAQSLASLQNAEVGLAQAKANFANAKSGGSETERDRDILRSKIAVAKENLAVARINYDNALSDAGKRRVVAPIDGTVNAINVKNGDDLGRLSGNSASQAPIIIGDLDTLKAQVQVNEVDIPAVSIGQKVTMTFTAIDGLSISGKVEKMDAIGTITQGVVNYNVTVGLDTIDIRLRSGMSVSAKIETGMKRDVIMVPNSALKMQGNKPSVDVLNSATGLPERRTDIGVGVGNNTVTEITSGIDVGDAVITQTIDPNAKTTSASSSGGNSLRIPGFGGR